MTRVRFVPVWAVVRCTDYYEGGRVLGLFWSKEAAEAFCSDPRDAVQETRLLERRRWTRS